jgi:hypothetical protein
VIAADRNGGCSTSRQAVNQSLGAAFSGAPRQQGPHSAISEWLQPAGGELE